MFLCHASGRAFSRAQTLGSLFKSSVFQPSCPAVLKVTVEGKLTANVKLQALLACETAAPIGVQVLFHACFLSRSFKILQNRRLLFIVPLKDLPCSFFFYLFACSVHGLQAVFASKIGENGHVGGDLELVCRSWAPNRMARGFPRAALLANSRLSCIFLLK